MGTKKVERVSPLKVKPLRLPGQSLDEQIDDYLQNHILFPFIVGTLIFILPWMELVRWYQQKPPQPLISLIAVIPVSLFCFWYIRKSLPRLRQLKLGRDGERAVGQALEALRAHGHVVLHDIVAEGFNLDHVVIGPRGIFAIETKTHSKASNATVSFGAEGLLVDGFAPDRDPLVQARAQADWLRTLLKQCAGQSVSVKPVVVFPGWWVEPMPRDRKDVWVLNDKALPGWIAKEPLTLAPQQIQSLYFHLGQYVRTWGGAGNGNT